MDMNVVPCALSTVPWRPLEQWSISVLSSSWSSKTRNLLHATAALLPKKSSQITKQAEPQEGIDMEAKKFSHLNNIKFLRTHNL
jgi:hypothetical protein